MNVDPAPLNWPAQSRWLNLGLWIDEIAPGPICDYPDAARALAEALARFAGFFEGAKLLDAGCGYGEQIFYWSGQYRLGGVLGIDRNSIALEAAEYRRSEAYADLNIKFRVIDAGTISDLPELDFFDFVVALDAAYFFSSRAKFIGGALKVLAPSGTLAIAELTPGPRARSFAAKAFTYCAAKLFDLPIQNFDAEKSARSQFAAAGFHAIVERDIGAEVIPGFAAYVSNLRRNPPPETNFIKLFPYVLSAWMLSFFYKRGWLGMVLVRGRKAGV